ncbi:G-type lectin S-receptor-like serine/threonine-protein kinase At4g11900 [Cornus florida]|uniref:G-type lectin S-receptor-like serine/threonine-protein kinase At4g11900 n=1 Tax=Cornus florida TaxID=4283 RepID=UPI00289BC6D4|nr:G-type lectin S-receptor-like serine/threonine-protein kinase At4g11900 [Cornus florida]
MGQSLSVSQTLVSQGSIFELGFFRSGTPTSHSIYLCIWYKNIVAENVVWVANREQNSSEPSSRLEFSRDDPDERNQYFIEWNNSKRYWSTGIWNGIDITDDYGIYYNFTSNENESYLTYSTWYANVFPRLVMDKSGLLMRVIWTDPISHLFWFQPSPSQVYAFCRKYGIWRENLLSIGCECLQGFKPFSIEDTMLNDWSGGCVRKTPLQCQNGTYTNGTSDGFLRLSNIATLPENSKVLPDRSLERCRRKNLKVIITVLILLAVGFIGCLIWRKLKQMGIREERDSSARGKDSSDDLLLFDFSTSTNAAAETNIGNNLGKNRKKDVELPSFSFASVSAATGNFSVENRLGEGGFGPVYKGKSLRGQEIAVKRLSRRSGQGFQEFRNEAVLISKLQHRNLVKLLGCCVERDENILIYEYMHNKSLDFFLFDTNKQGMLDWRTRIHIFEGIAQRLLYLHQYSRLRIIHRDLKANNILLDSEKNSKISDFGMAKIFGSNESEANIDSIVGTYGYMSPEYAMEGIFSIKSNVFSFGVLLLEIVSGKKNIGFHGRSHLWANLGYAWESWNSNRGMELMDPILGNPSSTSTLLRYINIGLLCVQENANDRPTMSDVVSMFSNEYAPLPTPKEPTFFTNRHVINTNPNNAGNCSVNTITLSDIEGR